MTRQPIKLIFLLQDLEFGGTQRYAANLLKYLNRERFQPEFWILRQGNDMLSLVEEHAVKVTYLSRHSSVGPRAILRLAWRLLHHTPEILYTLTVVPNIWGRLFASMLRVPVVVTGYRSLHPKQHDRLLWRLCDGILANFDAGRRILTERLGVDPRRVYVVPNGVDTDFFVPRPEYKSSRPTILFIGRLVKEKDPLTLLEAFRLTLKTVPEARLIILGSGYLKPNIQQFIAKMGLEACVAIEEGVRDIRRFLWSAWVLAMSSRAEASPNVILEAMASGVPVVATQVGGIPELIRQGNTGLLVPHHNPEKLSLALSEILKEFKESCPYHISSVYIWHAKEYDPDPILVATTCKDEENTWTQRADWLIARWGDALLPFEDLSKMALEKWKNKRISYLKRVLRKAQNDLEEAKETLVITDPEAEPSFYNV